MWTPEYCFKDTSMIQVKFMALCWPVKIFQTKLGNPFLYGAIDVIYLFAQLNKTAETIQQKKISKMSRCDKKIKKNKRLIEKILP